MEMFSKSHIFLVALYDLSCFELLKRSVREVLDVEYQSHGYGRVGYSHFSYFRKRKVVEDRIAFIKRVELL